MKKVKKVTEDIISVKTFSDEVCNELIEKVVVKSKTQFEFYIRGLEDNFESIVKTV